jgi:hypothetical protein
VPAHEGPASAALDQRPVQIRVRGRVRKISRLGEASGEPGSASVAFDSKTSRIYSSKLERNRSSLSV